MNGEEDLTTDRDPTTDRGEKLDIFGASAPPTLPVPSTPAPADVPSAPTTPVPAAPATTTAPVSPGPDDQRPARRSVRVRTVVFGLVMMAVSVVAQVGLLTSVRIDGGVVALTLLIGAGAALLLGGLSAAIRDVRRGGTRYS